VEVNASRPRWNATDFFARQTIHANMPYLHQLPCSWGAVYFPRHWREFYAYMAERYTEDLRSYAVKIPRSRSNGWHGSWKKFLVDLMYLRGYVTLYPNFPNQTSFSTNHMEPGVHINASGNAIEHSKEDFEVPLIGGRSDPGTGTGTGTGTGSSFLALLPDGRLPLPSRLPVLDLFNQISDLRSLKAAGSRLRQDVLPCADGEIVVADPVSGSPLRCSRF
jgi:hypothetical protein